MSGDLQDRNRVVITGVGLTAPNGDSLSEYRANLLAGKSGVVPFETRYVKQPVLAGVCNFDEFRYQKRKERRRGTRAGSVSIYCANEAIQDAGLDWGNVSKDRVGVYLGITEHGNVETENEIFEIALNRLGVDASDAVMVGDSEEADGAARELGCGFVLVDPLPTWERPDGLLRGLREYGLDI